MCVVEKCAVSRAKLSKLAHFSTKMCSKVPTHFQDYEHIFIETAQFSTTDDVKVFKLSFPHKLQIEIKFLPGKQKNELERNWGKHSF